MHDDQPVVRPEKFRTLERGHIYEIQSGIIVRVVRTKPNPRLGFSRPDGKPVKIVNLEDGLTHRVQVDTM